MMKMKSGKFLSKYLPLTLLAAPGLLYLIINNYIPIFGLFIAFKDYDFSLGIFNSPWCGLENFEYLFKTPDAFIITRNTILYNTGFIILNNLVAVSVAIALSEVKKKFLQRTYQVVFLLPNLISMVVVAYIVFAFLSTDTGFLNKWLLPLLGQSPKAWYTDPGYWPWILNIVNIWKGFGLFSTIYFASVISIPPDLYEAALLDGANKWQQIKSITLPILKPTIIMMVLMAIGRIFFSDFGLFYQVPMDKGALYPATNVIDTYVYRGLMQLGDIGMSSAAGFYQSVVGFALVLISNLLVRKIDKESALF
ncbi:binding-protein-dependent transport systems inner membrane component [Clostridium sp. CAG:1013]|nr:binding-protein-dependent transport systems inner membrane component [Clostridium sp. CAG:1013]